MLLLLLENIENKAVETITISLKKQLNVILFLFLMNVNVFPFTVMISVFFYSLVSAGSLFTCGNVLYVFLFGWWISLVYVFVGVLMFLTVFGIPYGKNWSK